MTRKHHATPTPNPPEGVVTRDLLARLADSLWLPPGLGKAERKARIEAAQAQLEDMAPGDGMEAMLAVQMIATHEASLACLHRAARGDQSPELCDQNLKHSERLLALYTRQMEVLGRHRERERQAADREAADQARRHEARGGKPPPVRLRPVYYNAEEWWAARAHVIDPRVVLAKTYARQDMLDAGLDKAAAQEVAEKVAEAVAANPPTIDGQPYIMREDGVRLYPLPDGELVPAEDITDTPFSGYDGLLRDRAAKQAAQQGEEPAEAGQQRDP
jgi:hypothetical protein